MELSEGRGDDAAAGAAGSRWGVALPDLPEHLHRPGGHAQGAGRTTPVVGADPDEHRHEPADEGRGPAASAALSQAAFRLGRALDAARASVIEYRAEVPNPLAFVRLFETTGWEPHGRLTVESAAQALASTWHAVSAYDGERLVGTGRIIGDGVLHALLVNVIVDPAYRHRGIGSGIVERLVAECRRHRIVDVQLFCAQGVRPFYGRLGFIARPDDAPGMELVVGDSQPG